MASTTIKNVLGTELAQRCNLVTAQLSDFTKTTDFNELTSDVNELEERVDTIDDKVMRKLKSHSNDFKTLKRKGIQLDNKVAKLPSTINQMGEDVIEFISELSTNFNERLDKNEEEVQLDIDNIRTKLKGLLTLVAMSLVVNILTIGLTIFILMYLYRG